MTPDPYIHVRKLGFMSWEYELRTPKGDMAFGHRRTFARAANTAHDVYSEMVPE